MYVKFLDTQQMVVVIVSIVEDGIKSTNFGSRLFRFKFWPQY